MRLTWRIVSASPAASAFLYRPGERLPECPRRASRAISIRGGRARFGAALDASAQVLGMADYGPKPSNAQPEAPVPTAATTGKPA